MTNNLIKIQGKTYTVENLKNSKSFCVLPWIHTHIWPNGTVFPCCQSLSNPVGKYVGQSLQEIANSEEYKHLRLKLINGEKVKECSHCYRDESKFNVTSSRQQRNEEYFTDHFNDVKRVLESTKDDGSIDFSMLYYDTRFSNICNLKCKTCGPDLSSKWGMEVMKSEPDAKSKRPYMNDNGIVTIDDISDSIYKELLSEKILTELKRLCFAGGEPLVSPEHYKILDGLLSVGNTDTMLLYNTNLTRLSYSGKNVLDYWKKFKFVIIAASVDDFGERLRYTRGGANWNVIESNFSKIHEHLDPNKANVAVSVTVSIFNAFYLPEILNEFLSNDKMKIVNPSQFFINVVFVPEYHSVATLPIAVKNVIRDRLNEFLANYKFKSEEMKKSVNEKVKYILSVMYGNDSSHLMPLLAKTITESDARNGESFYETFPELNHHLKLETYLNQPVRISPK